MKTKSTLAVAGGALLIAAGTVVFAASGWRGGSEREARAASPAAAVTNAQAGSRFACPMHPEVTSATRDRCSICGMYLEEAKAVPPAAAASPAAARKAAGGKCPYMSAAAKAPAHHAGGEGCCKDGAHARGNCPHEKAGAHAKGDCPHEKAGAAAKGGK